MTDKPAVYYQDWADRLNRSVLGKHFTYTPEYVAETERLSGKDIGDMTPDDFQALADGAYANVAFIEADADQRSADVHIIVGAMERRNARTTGDMVNMLQPTDPDFAEVCGAIIRIGNRLQIEGTP